MILLLLVHPIHECHGETVEKAKQEKTCEKAKNLCELKYFLVSQQTRTRLSKVSKPFRMNKIKPTNNKYISPRHSCQPNNFSVSG